MGRKGATLSDKTARSNLCLEAVELLEPRLNEAPDDDFAIGLYGAAVERAYATASADESAARERAAVGRLANRTGLIALRDAVRPSWTAPSSARRSERG